MARSWCFQGYSAQYLGVYWTGTDGVIAGPTPLNEWRMLFGNTDGSVVGRVVDVYRHAPLSISWGGLMPKDQPLVCRARL